MPLYESPFIADIGALSVGALAGSGPCSGSGSGTRGRACSGHGLTTSGGSCNGSGKTTWDG